MENKECIPYKDIPGFPISNIAGHADQLVFGTVGKCHLVAMQGRFHYEDMASQLCVPLQHGVYAIFPGPCYETAAEIRAYKALGADAIGMSTVPEATAAKYLGMEVMGIACITNMATGIAKTMHSHEEVLSVADASSKRFCALVEKILLNWPEKTTASEL